MGISKRKLRSVERKTVSEHLLEKLKLYGASDWYPLHMPGHKRQISHFTDAFSIDITEIEEFDNLHHAEGVLKEAQERAAKLYYADETFYLINGSSCGILAAVSACIKRGGHILMARNCHKAVYHAVLLNELRATYLYPSVDTLRGMNGAISPESVKVALDAGKDIEAVLITSPTYDGVCSNVREIARIVHEAGKILIVDEAHGAHFVMHPYFPETAIACGADIVINSLHKTMPSLTQTALLHCSGSRVDRERIKKYLGIYQTSSPSYVLMAGMDACVDLMLERGNELFHDFCSRLEQLRLHLKRLQKLHLVDGEEAGLCAADYDRSKVIVSTEKCGMTGVQLAEILRNEYHLEPEMVTDQYVTAIMTVCDSEEGFERLEQALLETDEKLCEADDRQGERSEIPDLQRIWNMDTSENAEMTISQIEYLPMESVRLNESAGCISGEFVYLYPPGIPLLVPGERISRSMTERLEAFKRMGLLLQGMADYSGETLQVVAGSKQIG